MAERADDRAGRRLGGPVDYLGVEVNRAGVLCILLMVIPPAGDASAQSGSLTEANAANVPPPLNGPPVSTAPADSFQLSLLALAIEEARVEVTQTDFWHRLIPQVHLSAGLGGKDILFPDPSSSVPYALPRDSWRLFVTLSLTELLDFSRHRSAGLRLARATTEYDRAIALRSPLRESARYHLEELTKLIALEREELTARGEIVRYDELRFQQGKIGYDVLERSRLGVIGTEKVLLDLGRAIDDEKLKLRGDR